MASIFFRLPKGCPAYSRRVFGGLLAGLVMLLVAPNLRANTNNAVDRELQTVMELDDEAQADVDRWIRENEQFAARGAGTPDRELNQRIRRRFEPVRRAYEQFLLQHSNHVAGRLAFAGFLGDINDTTNQFAHLELARAMSPDNPVVWNNLANYYAINGPTTNVFVCHERAIALRPDEPLYHHNLGSALLMFRGEATNFFHLSNQQLFLKALEHYQRAMKSDATNFPLATDLAQTYYAIQPRRTDEALAAWTNAWQLARDNLEREGVQVHLARVKLQAGRTEEARAHLHSITNENYSAAKKQLAALLNAKVAGTNLPAPPPEKPANP